MKKVVGIFMVMFMVFIVIGIALGEEEQWETEVINFCNEHESLKRFVESDEHEYTIINGCGYIYGKCTQFKDWHEYINSYGSYLSEQFPELAKEVKYEFTYTGKTEHTTMVCVWLKLENGKVFSDYSEYEPAVSELAGLIVFEEN